MSRFSLDGSSLAGIRSAQGQGAKSPEEFCGGKCVCFYLVSMCACFMPHNYPQRDNTAVVVIRAWFVHMNI